MAAAGGTSGHVGFLGLGAMGGGMAACLVRRGFAVVGFDVYEPSMDRLEASGGRAAATPSAVSAGASALVVMVTNAVQVAEALFGDEGAASGLEDKSVVIICSTVPPEFVRSLVKRLQGGGRGIELVDAPVSGGVAKAAEGTLTIMAAGSEEALRRAGPILEALSENLYTIPGGVGYGSAVKMVNQLLAGVHIATAAEAMALGAKTGLDTRLLFHIISTAAGSSWMFQNRVPHMLDNDFSPRSALDIFVKDLAIVAEEARLLKFPVPLASTALQQFLFASAAGLGKEDDAAVVKIWEKAGGVNVSTSAGSESQVAECLHQSEALAGCTSDVESVVAFIGLGAMGIGMASALLKAGLRTRGFDVFKPALDKFQALGGEVASNLATTVKGAQVVIIMVTSEDQVEQVLWGPEGVAPAMEEGAVLMLCSTVSPDYVKSLERKLHDEQRGLMLIDSPVSGGTARAADGTLTIMAAGSDAALSAASPVLRALSKDLFLMPGGPGAGSAVKMVNQLLAGVHIAVAAEAMALGARAGLDTRLLFKVISSAAGASWMYNNRVPHMLDNDYTPRSAVDIFVKDLGIVLGEAKGQRMPLPLTAAAHQQFLFASAAGFGREDDAAVAKVFEILTGVSISGAASPDSQSSAAQASLPLAIAKDATAAGSPLPDHQQHDLPAPDQLAGDTQEEVLSKESALQSLPPEWPSDPAAEIHEIEEGGQAKTMVVLDDDPTGTQTVHGVSVLMEWSLEALMCEMEKKPACFFILTNSRSLPTKQACGARPNVKEAAEGKGFTIVLRGDSTLRGHYPQEAEAAASVVGTVGATIICPFFLQGGRYTINDVHYVADGDRLVPAGQTEFAKDAAFGYKSSNLQQWVEEKTQGAVAASEVASISIETIRRGGPTAVCEQLCALKKGGTCIVNAASDKDMRVFSAGMLQAERKGMSFLCRTAASFVSARLGIIMRPPLTPRDLNIRSRHGALIVVGSYVPKTTGQVRQLQKHCGAILTTITVNARSLATDSDAARKAEIRRASEVADGAIREGKDVLVVTSRELITGRSGDTSLEIGSKVSSGLVEIVSSISTRPRYILAKGGITSSDIAVKALEARRAEVVGQAASGVPLWQLGPGSRHVGVPYIVFPGNVGDADALAMIVKTWALPPTTSTRAILEAAEKGGYAVGAFNVYNLEGAMAVVSAAEAECSPAILQIHPSALKHGGEPLVALCAAAAMYSQVPVAVHLDHASKEEEVMAALDKGFHSVMVDGSSLEYEKNVQYSKQVAEAAHARGLLVEAELGRLSGTEDGLTVEEYEGCLTDPEQAEDFLTTTQVDALAVCIGNVHGKYPPQGPQIDIERLKAIQAMASRHHVILVLHGASGLPADLVKECIKYGVRKFNVNTELRAAYMAALQGNHKDLLDAMGLARTAMEEVVREKLRMFGSSGKAMVADQLLG
eukprot:SM000048S16549  [mRNA]  locus=s48:290297:303770:- [translate_table: standard]